MGYVNLMTTASFVADELMLKRDNHSAKPAHQTSSSPNMNVDINVGVKIDENISYGGVVTQDGGGAGAGGVPRITCDASAR